MRIEHLASFKIFKTYMNLCYVCMYYLHPLISFWLDFSLVTVLIYETCGSKPENWFQPWQFIGSRSKHRIALFLHCFLNKLEILYLNQAVGGGLVGWCVGRWGWLNHRAQDAAQFEPASNLLWEGSWYHVLNKNFDPGVYFIILLIIAAWIS